MQSHTINPVQAYDGIPLFDEAAVRKYWDMSLPPQLQEDETIRIVSAVVDPETRKPIDYGMITHKTPFRNVEDVLYFFNDLQSKHPKNPVGISISTAVFNYTGETPKIDSFKYSNAIAIDIDTHIKGTKDRYPLGPLEDKQIQFAMLSAWLELSIKFDQYGLGIVTPKMSFMTGGGLQFILEFERSLNKSEAQRIYGLLKIAIGKMKWNIIIKGAAMGEFTTVDLDIDESSTDIAHVQRVCGSINQKYGLAARELDVFSMGEQDITNLKLGLLAEMDETGNPQPKKDAYTSMIKRIFEGYKNFKAKAVQKLNIEDNMLTAKMQSARTFIKPSELKSVEYDLLQKLKQSDVDTLTLLEGEVRFGPSSGNLTKLYCPFHEESNPSMAFYRNELFDVFKDFHDDTTYSLVTLWEKLNNISKSEAVSQIAERAGITLGKGERKDFQNLELAEIIDELLERIDVENFVYYRLANKNRTCVVRHIDSGEAFIFDGPKMLATHILSNQLNIEDAEQTLVHEFATRFQERVLIDAFEEFYPGKPTIFQKQFIKFVNLWVPSERYKRVHVRVEEIDANVENAFTLDEAMQLIKKKTPWTYKYILQLVQNGDLPWFINWLSGVSKFKPMPTVPVVFGVQGAGKNLFVNTVLDFYLNNEYIKVVSGDRIMQQFNSILESTNLLVLDEGDFSNGKEVDQLKMLTGNDKILIEKKGVDATNKTRHFNIMFFSNGEVPLRHPAMDRRITYFNNEIPLLASCDVWGITIDDLVERVRSELVEFWAIIYKTELDHKMAMANSKNGQFWKQVLMQHPFGALVVKLMNGEWEDIALQLNENVQDAAEMSMNLKLLQNIKEQFESSGSISLTLINRYLHSLNYRMKQSIQKFIQMNHLHEFGINVAVEDDDVKIVVNKKKVQESLKVRNVLKAAYPKTAKGQVSPLEAELAMEQADAGVESDHVQEAEEQIGIVPPPPPSF